MMNVLIGAVGYYNLRDLSLGPLLLRQLQNEVWPAGVELDDLSFGPIAVVQRMQDRPGHFGRVVLLAAAQRGRTPGGIYCYRWDGRLPPPEEIQRCVAEGVTGVVSLDNLLVIGGYFGVWPVEVIVIEVEPALEEWGSDFSAPVEAAARLLPALVRSAATGPAVDWPADPFAPCRPADPVS